MSDKDTIYRQEAIDATVSGRMKHLVSEPTLEWPQMPQWQGRWVYAGNNAVTQMWRQSDGSD